MFSVEDLLISHGYKQYKSPTNSSQDPAGGDQHENTGRQSGQASGNGLPIHPGAIPKTSKARKYQNDDESNLVTQGWQRNAYQEDFSGPGNLQGGLYDQSQLSRSSLSEKAKELSYWKRQCRDFSSHDYPDRINSETSRIDAAYALSEEENESQWKTEEEFENMRSNKQETMKPPGDYRRQSLKMEIWKQPSAFGRHEPEIDDNKERLHPDVYLERQNIAGSHVKNKSQSQEIPRFHSPENSNSAEIPAIASNKQHKVKPELESLKHSEPASRPKYGRPLKPPSYEFHQQSRGTVETNPPQQKHRTTFYVTEFDESGLDPTLGPPVYIPPPSYKSPGQQSKNQHVPEEVSDYGECYVEDMQVQDQGDCISFESLVNLLQMEEEEQILCSSKTQVRCHEKHLSSVQYIPFDDPRIRHIKVMHPVDHQVEDQAEDVGNSSILYKSSMDQEFNNSYANVPDSINTAVKRSQVSGSSRLWLEPNTDQDSCALSTQRGSYDTGNSLNCEYPKARPPAQSPGATGNSSEILTKVKAFEPGIEIQGKNHLKKKTNEAMFCLVSVPPQSKLNMPDSTSEKNRLDSSRDLKDQSCLSTSSTDLELQALTGNMINENVSEKLDFWRPEFKQRNDLICKQFPKHKVLEYSGSWPCVKYKDQETQTSFSEEPQIQQPLHGSQFRKSNTLTNGHFLKYGSSTPESAPSSLPTDNRKSRPIPPPRKAHLNKPSKPECPRDVLKPKTGQNESCTTPTGLPGQKNKPSFAHKEEKKSPCSTKEAFGQFLLKPVNRRPWDVISELENFNNEIQKQDERNEGGKENEQKQKTEKEKKVKKTVEKACSMDEVKQDHRYSSQIRKVKPITSLFKKETNKNKPESENASNISDTKVAFSGPRNVRSVAREMDKSVKEKGGNVGLKPKQENARKIIKQAIGLHPMKSNVSGCSDSENSSLSFNSNNSGEASVENPKNKDSDKLQKVAGRNIPASETASVAPLSFRRKNQGSSEPNLRSVGLDASDEASLPDSSTKTIPPNESLQARAARILGIEVAVESLTATNESLPEKDCDSGNMAQSSESSNKKILWAEMNANVAASKRKPKSGWPKSTFIGEDILGSVKDQNSGKGKLTREPSFRHHPDLSKHQGDRDYALESSMLPLAERKSLPSNVGKKSKSTSKVTLPKQGKVASAVSRATMDRLARMKEVDSVSRMRRLSIQNAGSGEDRDDDTKQVSDPEEKGNDSAVGCPEFPRKLSQGSCVSKRIITLNENGRLGNRNTKKSGRGLLSSEVYDPSWIEKV